MTFVCGEVPLLLCVERLSDFFPSLTHSGCLVYFFGGFFAERFCDFFVERLHDLFYEEVA